MLSATALFAAPAVQDTLGFTVFDVDTLMNTQGWLTYVARTGGWGHLPTDYTYRVIDTDGHHCVVDSYPYAQSHSQGTAILLDWDGNPNNGLSPLHLVPGMKVTVGVSLYIMPYAPNWTLQGCGHTVWGFGPGHVDPAQTAMSDAAAPYDWNKGRGPRLQYRLGAGIEAQDILTPELRGFNPESGVPTLTGKSLPTSTWVDLRLVITANADGKSATCEALTSPSGQANWTSQGTWTCPLDPTSTGADNPANWNALLLDLPMAQWSKQGYGDPTPLMRDRLDHLFVEVTPPNADPKPQILPMFQGNRPQVAATVTGPDTLFADDAPTWQVVLTNVSGAELRGSLSLRTDADPTLHRVLASDLHVADGAHAQFTVPPLFPLPIGDQRIQAVLTDAAGKETVAGSRGITVVDQLRPVPGMNLVRNASFELGPAFSGTPMRQGSEFYQTFVKDGNSLRWTPTNAEGWWVEGPSADGVGVVQGVAHSGNASLKVSGTTAQPRAVDSAFNRLLPAGPVTLSAWVKTQGCSGRLDLDLVEGWDRSPTLKQGVALPADTDWTRLSVTATAPDMLQAVARLQVDQGTVWLDDVQIEAAPTASAFNVRPEEWLRLSLDGVDDAVLAKWVQGDHATRKVTVHVDSRAPLTGTVVVRMGPWNQLAQRQLGQMTDLHAPQSFSFSTADLPVDAYVLTAELQDHGKVVASGLRDFAPLETIGGVASNGSLRARTAVRFAVATSTPPAQIFGIGNTVLEAFTGSWFGGWKLQDFAEARPLHFTTIRTRPDDDRTYLCAAAGASTVILAWYADSTPAGKEAFANPAFPGSLDIYNPGGWAAFVQQAEDTGRNFGANPFIQDYQMANECPYLNDVHLCPSTYADADFRAWCQTRYGNDLSVLNGHWGTSFTSWDQVEQVASARFADEVRNAPVKQGAAALDWMANTGTFSDMIVKRMQQHPGWSMDWLRWWTDSSLRMFFAFREHARKFDKKTLYGNNLCWPAFWPQLYMPFLRGMDNGQLDIMYTSGMPRSEGTPSEMMDSMEMTEATVPGKPIWGHEIYYQPQWPAEYIALQNWGLIAHGMTNDLTFAWKPYSDAGPVTEPHAWEKPDAHPMWFIIDTDGTKLPAYYSYVRSINEIRAFHQRYDGLSLKRASTAIGFYVSPDTGHYVMYETANKAWLSVWQQTRNTLIFGMRLAGMTVRYLDDVTLPDAPGQFTTIVVPAAYSLNQVAAQKLAAFAKAGGTVVLAGATGVVDPWLAQYPNLGGAAWADLAWQAPDFKLNNTQLTFLKSTPPGPDGGLRWLGTGVNPLPGATALTDAAGTTIGWQRPWGQGKLIAYTVLPDNYTTDPHPSANLLAWIEQWRGLAGLTIAGRWVNAGPPALGLVGTGSPAVEVVVREKSPSEKFVFCLNQGGPGDGTVEIPVTPGTWRITDALTGQAVAGAVTAGVWKTPLHLEALGYRVIRFVRQ
jgi:hypothetical protein